MKVQDYYDDLDNSEVFTTLHNKVKALLTLDDLVSVVVCVLL
jgi:hypothetical protein